MVLSRGSIPLMTYYHSSVDWHIWQLSDSKGRKTPFAAVLYPFGFRLSRKSGRFHCSAVRLAEHFGVSKWTVIRAMDALTRERFFVL